MRAHHDVIMVGVGTVLADDPLLTVRLPGIEHRSPVRVILDSSLRTPLGSRLVAGTYEIPTWIVTAESAPVEAERRLVEAGVEVMRVSGREGRVDVGEALRLLGSRGVTRVFSEGGPSLGEALVEADLVDVLALATNRRDLGGEGIPALGPKLTRALNERMVRVASEDLGDDRLELFERKG
jgi:diaminohydroxyphosphoribosylaminopyrimidine deaminase/5-amino-6-(5-phosphoribosylamino)uracil reductase